MLVETRTLVPAGRRIPVVHAWSMNRVRTSDLWLSPSYTVLHPKVCTVRGHRKPNNCETFWTNRSLHGAWSFERLTVGHLHVAEPEGSLPRSQQQANAPYSVQQPPFMLILPYQVRQGLPSLQDFKFGNLWYRFT
jgi:hypothetical protein